MKKILSDEKFYEKHVSNQPGGALYYMWMLPSKVMPYLHRLAAPLTETSIVQWNDFYLFLIYVLQFCPTSVIPVYFFVCNTELTLELLFNNSLSLQTSKWYFGPEYDTMYMQKYSRLRCLLHVNGLVICFHLG